MEKTEDQSNLVGQIKKPIALSLLIVDACVKMVMENLFFRNSIQEYQQITEISEKEKNKLPSNVYLLENHHIVVERFIQTIILHYISTYLTSAYIVDWIFSFYANVTGNAAILKTTINTYLTSLISQKVLDL